MTPINRQIARRISRLPAYIFTRISEAIERKRQAGIDVISFGIADPDRPTPPSVLDVLGRALKTPVNHRYPSSEGSLAWRSEVARFYERRFQVKLDPEEQVATLIGAKEGIAHAALALLNPGDLALTPDPCYPVYPIATQLADAQSYSLPLSPSNGYMPCLDELPAAIAKRAKLLWLNYPNNPTGAVVGLNELKKVVEFARRNSIVVLYDNCYSEITFDGYKAPSILQVDGASELALEFNSLSKSSNMTGWRIGMAVGNRELINALRVLKSNIDSGVPQAIQEMGIEALQRQSEWIAGLRDVYARRRDKVVATLRDIGLQAQKPLGGLCVWASIPAGCGSSEFAEQVLEQVDVVVTPGNAFGTQGEGWIRLALTIPDAELNQGLDRLGHFKMPG